jgi:hypothetical protein
MNKLEELEVALLDARVAWLADEDYDAARTAEDYDAAEAALTAAYTSIDAVRVARDAYQAELDKSEENSND